MDEKDNELDNNDNTYDFVNRNKKSEDSEKTFLDKEKEKEISYKNLDDINETDDQEEEKGIIKRFIPDTAMFNNKNLKIMGFVLIAMIFSFGILPKFMSDRKKKDKKDEEIAIANPEAMKVNDVDGENADPDAMAEINTPVDPNAPVNPNEINDNQLPSYYNNNTSLGNDIPMDDISMNDIRSSTKQAYDLSDVNGANTSSSGIFDEINNSQSNISSGNANNNGSSGNKKRGIEFVSSKGNVENSVAQQLAQNPANYLGQPQLPQQPSVQLQEYDQNRQASKQNFLNSKKNNDIVSKKYLNIIYSKI